VSFATRWPARRAYDAQTRQKVSNQLFHSQCWRHLEREFAGSPGVWFEVRVIAAPLLATVITSCQLGSLADSGNLVRADERWICQTTRPPWNVQG
jgi:hypothetical protein